MSVQNIPHDVVADFAVRFGRQTIHASLPLTASLLELKVQLETHTGVPTHKQRLLFNVPVLKELRRDHVDTTRIAHLLSLSLLEKLREYAAPHATARIDPTTPPVTPQHVSISAMLVGSVGQASQIDSKATSEVSRLVSSTVEFAGRWYRCSYDKGYVRQTAFVCRTCVNEGRAEAGHALCLACSEMCHSGHEVEEWGVRSFMRCDCCTARCWRTPSDATTAMLPTNTVSSGHHTHRGGDSAAAVVSSDAGSSVSALASSAAAEMPTRTMQAVVVTNGDVVDRARHKRARSCAVDEDGSSATVSPLLPSASPPALSGPTISREERSEKCARAERACADVNADLPGTSAPSTATMQDTTSIPLIDESSDKGTARVKDSDTEEEGQQQTQNRVHVARTSESAANASATAHTDSVVSQSARDDRNHTNNEEECVVLNTPATGDSHAIRAGGTLSPATASVIDTPDTAEPPPPSRCLFLLDRETGKPPVSAILPTNRKNRYPRDALQWCYCKEDSPNDDPECGGISCLLCSSCFWSSHVTRLHTSQMRRVSCYGDVEQGDTLAFRCHTCHTLVCPPCRHRCHREHHCDPEPVVISSGGTQSGDDAASTEVRQSWRVRESVDGATEAPTPSRAIHENTPAGAVFSCGCRGLCSIAERVPEEEVQDDQSYTPMSAATATAMMNNDTFTAFVCAHCMQEYPWLVTEDPMRCYGGVLPPPVTDREAILPVIACGTASDDSDAATAAEVAREIQREECNESVNGVNCPSHRSQGKAEDHDNHHEGDSDHAATNDTSSSVTTGVHGQEEEEEEEEQQQQHRNITHSRTSPSESRIDSRYFPYHGMLVPSNTFMEGATCPCASCRAAYDALAPRSDKTATEMIVELHDRCDNCQSSIKDRQAFMCVTCETALAKTFFICSECNALRQQLIDARHRIHPAGESDRASRAAEGVSVSAPADDVCATREEGEGRGDDCACGDAAVTRAYHHELSHEFFEDTVQNLYTLCGMQVINNIDASSRAELMEQLGSLPEGSDLGVTDAICDVFGQIPVQLDAEEMLEFAALNRVAAKPAATAKSGGAVAADTMCSSPSG